jgi:hypothetical protein
MSDHDDSTASLGRAEVSCVDHSVADAVPAVNQTTEDGGHVPPVVGLEETFWVLDDDPSGSGVVDESEVFVVEETDEVVVVAAALTGETGAMRCSDAGVLAGEAADEDIGVSKVSAVDVTDVACSQSVGPVVLEHRLAVLVELDLDGGGHAARVEADVEAADSGERAGVPHRATSSNSN